MSDKLSKSLEQQIEPKVVSQANPDRLDLLQARADVQAHAEIREIFREGLPARELATRLAAELRKMWPEGAGDPTEAAEFLADEYEQVGPQGVQLINTETGRIAAIVREDDLYQPEMVPREGGSSAQPLARIKPDLESAVVMWFHDKGREEKVLKALAKRGHQTELLREMGDPRLLVATRRGRRHIIESLAKIDPKTLLEATGGSAGAFLRFFSFDDPADASGLVHLEGTVSSRSTMGVQDALTTNLHHNRPDTLRGALVQGWVREIARRIADEVFKIRGFQGLIDVNDSRHKLPHDFWIATPDMVRPFHKMSPKAILLPVETVRATAIKGTAGYLKVPGIFEAFSREISDRWEAGAALDFEVWLDPKMFAPYNVEGVEQMAQVL